MVDIQSKEVIDKISDELKIQPSMQIPRQLAKDIQLSYNVNPVREVSIKIKELNDGTATTIHTADSVKRTFITGGNLAVAKDVVNTSQRSSLDIFPLKTGVSTSIMQLKYEPLTAGDSVTSVNFPEAIEVQKGSTIILKNSNGTASINTFGSIVFYETDPE